jgi:Fe2+ or Zn2+ uptake regulation protein
MHEATVSEIARAILEHLRKNPEAQDTLAGVVQWWLPSHEINPRTATIKDALDELVATGLVTEFEGTDAQISYRMTTHDVRNCGEHAQASVNTYSVNDPDKQGSTDFPRKL